MAVFAGYQAALQDSGFAYDPSLVCNVLNNGPALRAVDKLFDERNPDGFFCFNDRAHGMCTNVRHAAD